MLCSAQGLHATECTGCGERRALLLPSRFHPLHKAGEGEQPFAPTPSLTRVHRLSSVCRKRTLVCPHPQPLSHSVGEGRRGARRWGARRCALPRVPPRPPAGEGDKGGEGKKSASTSRRGRKENRTCPRDFVPEGCTLISYPLPH